MNPVDHPMGGGEGRASGGHPRSRKGLYAKGCLLYTSLRGLVCTALKNNDETIATLYERILGRVSVHDIVHPTTGELIVAGRCV